MDATWLRYHDYTRQLWHHYAATGLLEQLAPRVFRRPRGPLTWEQVVISLQAQLRQPLVVGGRTALELQGYAHYLSHEVKEVHLYGPKRPPGWLNAIRTDTRIRLSQRPQDILQGSRHRKLPGLDWKPEANHAVQDSLTVLPWGQWNWPLTVSSAERAILELLDELPKHESFHQADVMMEGLPLSGPDDCKSCLRIVAA